MVLLFLLLNLLDLHVIMSPNDTHPLGLCHILELLEILPDVPLVSSRVEYLDLKSHKVICECLQDNEHYTAHYHLIDIVWVLYPNILKSDDVLPAPFYSQVLISVQEL
jgi:hypothetical protein